MDQGWGPPTYQHPRGKNYPSCHSFLLERPVNHLVVMMSVSETVVAYISRQESTASLSHFVCETGPSIAGYPLCRAEGQINFHWRLNCMVSAWNNYILIHLCFLHQPSSVFAGRDPSFYVWPVLILLWLGVHRCNWCFIIADWLWACFIRADGPWGSSSVPFCIFDIVCLWGWMVLHNNWYRGVGGWNLLLCVFLTLLCKIYIFCLLLFGALESTVPWSCPFLVM